MKPDVCDNHLYVHLLITFGFFSFVFRERTRTNFFAQTRKKLQYSNPIKYSNRTALDNDLRILATACNHRVPSDTADLEQIIESYRNKAGSMKSVQNNTNDHLVYQKQNMSYCKSPITIHNQWGPFTIPHSPPYYGPQIPLPYMYHRTPSPRPQSRPTYMQPTASSVGLQSPVWHSPTGNVNYRRQNFSSDWKRKIPVRNRSPRYYSSSSGRYHEKSKITGRGLYTFQPALQ